ncbi:adenylyl-sulfate kinase [Caballeronia sp. S22]|uniref:adenylyl-sulfate kinase n=1 Tax=Caballeronia sp. S22 TaxID=3137182 RepID=UPI0035315A56
MISPTRAGRELVREVIDDGFPEIFIDAPIFVCKFRNPKRLYERVQAGAIKQFTGFRASMSRRPTRRCD